MGKNGDATLTQDISSIIGQEGEQQGWFRVLGSKIPSELPFLTNSVRDFAFNALNQNFIVPGSCSNIDQITSLKSLHVMQPLNVVKTFDPEGDNDETVQLSFELSSGTDPKDYVVAYINQQNIPFTLPYTVVKHEGENNLLVQAPFPFKEHLLNGLTILAIVPASLTNIASNQEVADFTLAGPGLVIVN